MKQISFFIILLLIISGCSQKEVTVLSHKVSSTCHYYSLKSAQCLAQKAFIERVEPYDVIFVGDHHHSANAHKVMLTLIDGLSDKGYKISLANEWFSPQDNTLLKKYVNGKLDSNTSKVLNWKKRVGYDFNLSEPIYKAVIENGGKLYGVNMQKTFKKMVSEQNLTGMSVDERSFYNSLDLNVTAHKQLIAPFFAHCHGVREGESAQQCSERMYRVQVAWDSMMGEESAKLAEKLKAKEKLIVFIGAMHLESKLGANLRFARASTKPFITILPYPKESNSTSIISVDVGSSDMLYLYEESVNK